MKIGGIKTLVKNRGGFIVEAIRENYQDPTIPGGDIIWKRYQDFLKALPHVAQRFRFEVEDLIFNDYTFIVAEWLTTQASNKS